MLETFMFATESFGTWGPGPAPEPLGYWTRILDAVANDPRAVATIIAAFLGFLFGALIKYGLDRLTDRLRRKTYRRNLESALGAELLSLEVARQARIKDYTKLLNEYPNEEVLGGAHSFVRMPLPPRRVWMAQLGRIGELKGVDTDTLTLVHALFDNYDLAVETERQRTDGKGVHRETLQRLIIVLERMREAIIAAGAPFLEQTAVDQSWWRRVLDI